MNIELLIFLHAILTFLGCSYEAGFAPTYALTCTGAADWFLRGN